MRTRRWLASSIQLLPFQSSRDHTETSTMSRNPYANPNTPFAAYQPTASSSSTAQTAGPYYPGAGAYPAVPSAYSAYPTYPAGPSYPTEALPVAGPSAPGAVGVGYDMEQLQQASIYTPEASKSNRNGVVAAGQKGKARTTVLRKGGGEVWEDQSLLEWDPSASPFLRLLLSSTY